jgi:hypothetical protein
MKKKSKKRVSRKDAKHVLSKGEGAPRFGEIGKCFTLRTWRDKFIWLFRVYCDELFTQRPSAARAATKSRNISRKAAKEKRSELGVLGAFARE